MLLLRFALSQILCCGYLLPGECFHLHLHPTTGTPNSTPHQQHPSLPNAAPSTHCQLSTKTYTDLRRGSLLCADGQRPQRGLLLDIEQLLRVASLLRRKACLRVLLRAALLRCKRFAGAGIYRTQSLHHFV